MLQIIFKRTALWTCLAAALAAAGPDGSSGVDWLLKDAHEEEYIPLSSVEVTMPAEVRTALDNYHRGNYRKSVETLEKIRSLNLPDGRIDFVAFALAESYRQLGCTDLAALDYAFVIKNFPGSDKTAPSFYRLLEFAVRNDDPERADSMFAIIKTRYAQHPLINSASYLCGLLSFRRNDYEKAVQALQRVSSQSSRYYQAQFLLTLCYLQMKDFQKSLLSLEEIRKIAPKGELGSEASIMIGDIYYVQNNPLAALKYYQEVPQQAKRYPYALVKIARIYIDIGKYADAIRLASKFLDGNKNSEYFFEMASILAQAYTKQGREKDAVEVSQLIGRQIVDARLVFEIYDEIDKVTDIMRGWQDIEHLAVRTGNLPLRDKVKSEIGRLQDLERNYYALLKGVAPVGVSGRKAIPYQAERRYMGILKLGMALYDDTLTEVQRRFEGKMALIKKNPSDSLLAKAADSLSQVTDTLKLRRQKYTHEYDLVVRECIGKDYQNREADEDLQAKFVDWAFILYQEKKDDLKKINQQLSARKRASAKGKEPQPPEPKPVIVQKKPPAEPEKAYTEADRDRVSRQIIDDRVRLESHIKTILEVYPKSRYNPQILFRLAEIYFDAAGDDFQTRLKAYEQKMATGKDTAGVEFPEYHLDSVIRTYDRIIVDFPHSEVADAAYYYKALAQQKFGQDSLGNLVLLQMISKYPESQYYVEANMNIGKYYFDHPKTEKGMGYKHAEEAYRRVLFFRDHPEYVSALYHLGWCYYMQDRYEEAIAVFKYMIEESHLDFDPSKMDEKQLANPLLRGEAIDYIAISFDAENKVDNAIQFLKLVGNVDYAAMVLKRIGELREEDLDYDVAIRIYKRLLAEYPQSRDAPVTYVSLMRLYESRGKPDSAMLLREEFFAKYTKGSEWQKKAKDTSLIRSIDSMAIMNGLYVADAAYRRADSTKNRDDYMRAAKNYQRLVENYGGDKRAAEALWNLAIILDHSLQDKPQAFDRYVAFSRLQGMDSTRREQAALNAIAIAQALLPPDSVVQQGTVDFAANKVVEAVNNYATLFPNGAAWSKVMLSLGAIYFNRHLFTNAAKIYEQVVSRGSKAEGYFEALSFLGQCHYGEENWPAAITAFEKVWKESKDPAQTGAAYKLLLQSEFLNAKKFLAASDFAAAADLFRSIDDKYPNSEYGDIALFNSAESYEKIQKPEIACDRYYDLVKRYSTSKLAPDALFNAAGDYEKLNKYDKAAAAYELIASDYPYSEKAKDALFNVGFCYEKLGQLDKMADANERYSARYPGEKDVEAMLLRSASFYAKANMWDRAVSVYRNFVRRYPRNPKSIEAYFMIAKCSYDQGDKVNALLEFSQAEQQNLALSKDNLETNNYYAAEAAYYTGLIQREKILAIKLKLPDDELKRSLKEKSDLLAEAAKAFQRVMQYRSERMFEAAYRVGQLYEDLSAAWKDQERAQLDPIKMAVMDKDILMLSSGLLQKTFIPYEKALSLAKGFDSLGGEQKSWVARSESSLKRNYIDAGDMLREAISSMSSAPVPKEIKEKPLHYFQYLKQVLEAVTPMREQVREYYTGIISHADSIGIKGGEIDSCRNEYAKACYNIGEGYDHLSTQILRTSKEVSKDLPQDEREDLVFQLEDIVYELQDKAIYSYEDGLKRIKKMNLQGSRWANEIIGSLARLSPDKYGAAYFIKVSALSNGTWIVRPDSVADWNSSGPPADGWLPGDTALQRKAPAVSVGSPLYIRGPAGKPSLFVWKNIFLVGAPRNANVYIASPCRYRLFINGALILSDTVGGRDPQKIDSATGITRMLQGGDNFISAEISGADSAHEGVAVAFGAMIDTSEHFKSSVKLPSVLLHMPEARVLTEEKQKSVQPEKRPADQAKKRPGKTAAGTNVPAPKSKADEYSRMYRNRGEFLMAIDNYNAREHKLTQEISTERVTIQNERSDLENAESRIKAVRQEIEELKTRIAGMSRSKDDAGQAPPPAAQDTQKVHLQPAKPPTPSGAGAPVPAPVKQDSQKIPTVPAPTLDTAKKASAPTAAEIPKPRDTAGEKPSPQPAPVKADSATVKNKDRREF